MAELTLPLCANCGIGGKLRFTCCSPEYCEMAAEMMKEEGVEVPQKTDHPKLPFMGTSGCIIHPQYRPLCTFHVCSINGVGTTKDPETDKKYFSLREEIEEVMFQISQINA